MILSIGFDSIGQKELRLIAMQLRREKERIGQADLKEIDRLIVIDDGPLNEKTVERRDLGIGNVEINDSWNHQRWTLKISGEKRRDFRIGRLTSPRRGVHWTRIASQLMQPVQVTVALQRIALQVQRG